jgi:hypothetical protein
LQLDATQRPLLREFAVGSLLAILKPSNDWGYYSWP